jgi:glycosyltransferase involved in cell wall biosynthesis
VKVLLINTSDAGGGAQEIGARLMRELRARGHEATMAVGHRVGDEPGVEVIPNWEARNPVARGAAHLAHVTGRDWIRRAGEPLRTARVLRGQEDFSFPGTWKLLRRLRASPPDVIHAHNLHGGYFDLRALPELSRIAPLVLTLHDMWLMTGHVAHSFDCERWRTGCGNCPYLDAYAPVPRDRTAWNWQRKRALYSESRLHVATPSEWLHTRVGDSMLTAGLEESRVIPNGVDLDRFSPGDRGEARRRLGLPADARVLLFAANSTRSNEFKDFATLERALERLGSEVIAVSVGEAGESRRIGSAELRMVEPQSDLTPWYRAADLYVHPARADTFPTTVLEALASGLPVVASAVGGIPELVMEGETGHLVPVGDAQAMAGAIDSLLTDPERRSAMAAAARADAVERFDARRMVNAYVDWYESLSSSIADSSRMRSA